MKVKIGPYKSCFGPYQLADLIKYIGFKEKTVDKFGDFLADTWIDNLLKYIDDKKERKINIRIDRYDTFNADHTLSLIILPILKQLKEQKHGAPYVDNEDVPEHLHDTKKEIDQYKNDGKVTDKFFERWDYVLDEMIFAFEMISKDDDWQYDFRDKTGKLNYVKVGEIQERISNGLKLFGKYYEGLWT